MYGAPDVHPQVETYHGNVNPSGARSCYNEGKRFGEAVCRAYRDLHDVDTVIVRIFNTYGPRMRPADGRLVPTFIRQALTNRPITVHGLGEQTRSLCTPGPINVGNPYEQTVVAIARLICELCGSDSPIEYVPAGRGPPRFPVTGR